MIAANAAAAERGSILVSSRAVFTGVEESNVYRITNELSTFQPIGNVRAEVILRAICRGRQVSRPVGRVLMAVNGIGGLSI